ncbi:MAG: O-antigen biosynthesis protein WbqV, partial [Maricaulis maris]
MSKAPSKTRGVTSIRSQISMVAVALFDLAAGAISMWVAVLLRYRFEPIAPPDDIVLQSVAVFALACAIIFPIEGLHRGLWRYTALNDAARIVRAIVLANLVFLPILFLINRLDGFPRTSILLEIPILLFILLAARLFVAALRTQGLRGALQIEDR